MAFPYIFAENFELATRGLFDAETDTGSILDFPHYSELARNNTAPYRGAYCLRVRLAGATDAYVQENASFDFAADALRYVRWYFYLGRDFTMADTNKFAMFNLESVADTTVEVAAGIDRSGASLRFWYSETNAAAAQTITLGTLDAPGNPNSALGRWYHAELEMNIDDGVGNNGDITGYINDQAGTQITTLDQGAGVDAKLGAITVDAGTTGTLLIDDILVDDVRIFRDRERFSDNRWMVAAQDHPIIGPGRFSAAVTGTGTDAVMSLYDSDGVPNRLEPMAVLRNVSANEFIPGHDVFDVKHGLYAVTTGTEVQAFFSIERTGVVSQGGYVTRGMRQGIQKP